MILHIISQNPYRTLGVLSNSPLRERVGNQNRLAAFAKVGKDVAFPNDFSEVITEKPLRTSEAIVSANNCINLDKDQLKFALFWFIDASPMDVIALKHLQTGNIDKAKEILQKKETFASLINRGVLAFIEGDIVSGFSNISKVIHNQVYRSELFQALGIANLTISEDEFASMFIEELLTNVSAKELLEACSDENDRAIISKRALEEPISVITSAISVAKSADAHDPAASLAAGKKLMTSTKEALDTVREIAGASSPQYQMMADNLAKQILQCGINYYNNASDDDVESPRKAMELQSYALKIAVGKLTKDRCQENYNILKKAVDNMPPAEVAVEVRKVKEELRKFCQLPDKISHSVTLLNNTKPLLQTIKSKLGATNTFYLSLSTQVVGNALHNVIEEVNTTQTYFMEVLKAIKKTGIDPRILNSIGHEHSPANIIEKEVKPVMRDAWKAIALMDSFDMEADFKKSRYNPNRQSLKKMCVDLGIRTSYINGLSSFFSNTDPGCLAIIICAVIGGIIGAINGNFTLGLIIGGLIVGGFISKIIGD